MFGNYAKHCLCRDLRWRLRLPQDVGLELRQRLLGLWVVDPQMGEENTEVGSLTLESGVLLENPIRSDQHGPEK